MRYPLKRYTQLRGIGLPELGRILSAKTGTDIGPKTLWNWGAERYDFRVYVECADDDIRKITGVIKESRIL